MTHDRLGVASSVSTFILFYACFAVCFYVSFRRVWGDQPQWGRRIDLTYLAVLNLTVLNDFYTFLLFFYMF